MKLLISACLLGDACRYNGEAKPNKAVMDFVRNSGHTFIKICPEAFGGLPIPRPPCEITNGKVLSKIGEDVTAQFTKGAETVLAIAKKEGCAVAILKERSPSCGLNLIYDGSFTGKLVKGDGVTAALLKANGLRVFGETQLHSIPYKNEL